MRRVCFRANGIDLSQSAETKSDLYLTTLGKVNSGQVELLDVPKLLRQLRGLERRAMRGGREAVDHRRGAYDDVANVAAGLIATAATQVHDEDFFGFSNEWYGGGQFEDPLSDERVCRALDSYGCVWRTARAAHRCERFRRSYKRQRCDCRWRRAQRRNVSRRRPKRQRKILGNPQAQRTPCVT